MTAWQRFRRRAAILSEGIGFLFVIWAAYLQFQNIADTVDEPNIFGIWLGIIGGFIFLLVGSFFTLSLKKHLAKGMFIWLSAPALMICLLLFGVYIFAFWRMFLN
jgi:hypothetical protein